MKITWKEGKESHSAEGTEEQLASHIAYLDASGIKYETKGNKVEEVGEVVINSEDAKR